MTKALVVASAIAVASLLNCLPSSFAQYIEAVDSTFTDESHGWISVGGSAPAILRTADAGRTWTKLAVPAQGGFYRICFYDTKTGVAIQSQSENGFAIYWSVDGGQTWTKVNEVKTQYLHVVDLKFISAEDVLLAGEGSGGIGWVADLSHRGRALRVRSDLPVDFTTQSNTLAVFGDGTGHEWVAGKQLILHSANNGKTWENQYTSSAPPIDLAIAAAALPGGHAWLAVANWKIYRTDDYGKHWAEALETNGINFDSISFSSPTHGCAVGSSPYLYCTNDGGRSWSQTKPFVAYLDGWPYSSKLVLFRSSHGWASVGGILYKTADGGRSFTQILPRPQNTKMGTRGESAAAKTSINAPISLAFDGEGFLYIVESRQQQILRLDLKRSSIKVVLPQSDETGLTRFDFPNSIAADRHGGLFIGDFNGRLRKLDTRTGKVDVLGSEAAWKSRSYPESMAVDEPGGLLIATGNQILRWAEGAAALVAFAGSSKGFGGDDGPAEDARFAFAMGLAIDKTGDILVADYENGRIRKIDHRTLRISTIAGTGTRGSTGDGGPAVQASLTYPTSIATDGDGNVFFVDGATRIRRIDKSGRITAYAGTETPGFSGDGGPADQAMLNGPTGLAVDSQGNLFIAEYVNNRIRRVDAVTHIITTVAGTGFPHRIEVSL